MEDNNLKKFVIRCSVLEDENNKIKLELEEDNKKSFISKKLLVKSCQQNSFCEQLPNMMNSMIEFIEKNYGSFNIKNIKFLITFEKDKHLTTARVLESFIRGLLVK